MKQGLAPTTRAAAVAGHRPHGGSSRGPRGRGDKDLVDPTEVLIVDDDRNIRETIAEFLAFEGYHVVHAENGERALETLREGPLPAVILLDLMMPIMSGFEFLEVAEQDERLRRLPVVVVSALPTPVSSQEVEGGIKGWLGKPVDFDKLLALVAGLCDQARERLVVRGSQH